jgi:hypothetical protein
MEKCLMDDLRTRVEVLESPPWERGRHRRWYRAIVPAIVLLVLGLVTPGRAGDFSCAAGDVACLIDAINTANANGEANTISLEAGFYTLLSPFDPGLDTAVGLPAITSTLTIRGASGISTVIERDPDLGLLQPWFRILTVGATGNLTLADLTLQGGVGPFLSPGGGGVLNEGVLTVVDSVIKRNDAGPSNAGGGIFSSGTLVIVGSTITENTADVAAGLAGGLATLIVETSIVGNRSFLEGGGLVAPFLPMGPGQPVGSLLVENSTIARNVSSRGSAAGVSTFQGTATFINSTIADNVNESPGPGMSGAPGAGMTIGSGNPGGRPVAMVNTILARNTAVDSAGGAPVVADCAGDLISFGHNLIGDPSGCTVTLLTSDLAGNPGLGRFKDNGRPGNGHFPLSPSSQAIDAGDEAVCPRVDQLGRPRIGPCDIGAIRFERDAK